MNNEIYQIAIDGPSGAGKSTIAKKIAEALDIDYIDTGAMYRAIAYKIIKEDINPNSEALNEMLKNTTVDFTNGDVLLDSENINNKIRTPEVTKMASSCSAIPEVRHKLVELQRAMGQEKSVIMDGRDIGTNVFTDAQFKYFLTASAEERAKRRFLELKFKDPSTEYDKVLADIVERDHNDSTRKVNPLTKADDAKELDTTGLGITEVTELILNDIKEKLCQ